MLFKVVLIGLALSFSVLQLSEPNTVALIYSQQELTIPALACFNEAGSYTVALSVKFHELPSVTASFLSIQGQTSPQKAVVQLSKTPQGETEAKVALRDGSQLSVSVKAVVGNTWEQIVLTASYLGADSVLTLCSVSEVTQCSYVTSQLQFESLDSSLDIINLGNAEVKLLAEITNAKIIPQALTCEEISQLSKSQTLPSSNAAISTFNPTCDALSLSMEAVPIDVKGSTDQTFTFAGDASQNYLLQIKSRAYTGIIIVAREVYGTIDLEVATTVGKEDVYLYSEAASYSKSIIISKRDSPFNKDNDGLKRDYTIYCTKSGKKSAQFVLDVLLFTSNTWHANDPSLSLIKPNFNRPEHLSLSSSAVPIDITKNTRNGVMVYPGSLKPGQSNTYTLNIPDTKYSGIVLTMEVVDGIIDLYVTTQIGKDTYRYNSVKDGKYRNITISKNDKTFKNVKTALQGDFTIHCTAGSVLHNVYVLLVTLYKSNPWEESSLKQVNSLSSAEETSESSHVVILSALVVGLALVTFGVIRKVRKSREEWRSELEVRLTQDS